MNFKIETFDFVGHRKKFFIFSLVITLLGILTLAIFGLNMGVDFSSGTTMDIAVGQSITQEEAEDLLAQAGAAPPAAPTIGGDQSDRVTVRYKDVLTEEQRNSIQAVFADKFGADNVSYVENTVDAGIAREFAQKTILYVGIACLGIIAYVAFRFEWRFSIAAIVSLAHDAFIVISIFSIFRLEVNLPFVAAILTIIGYSINDTIVIFDRIRENLRFAKLKSFDDLKELVNVSIRQTFTRTINTTLTVLVCAVALLVFAEEIRLFSLAMLIGLLSGAYSTIFIASSLWILLKNQSLKKERAAANAAK